MRDFDVYELNTAEDIDAAFAKTFGFEHCEWAQYYEETAVSDFLEGLRGNRYVYSWTVELRNWIEDGPRYKCVVSNQRSWGGVKLGNAGWGYSEYVCHALMKAAIDWDQRRRERLRLKDHKRRVLTRAYA